MNLVDVLEERCVIRTSNWNVCSSKFQRWPCIIRCLASTCASATAPRRSQQRDLNTKRSLITLLILNYRSSQGTRDCYSHRGSSRCASSVFGRWNLPINNGNSETMALHKLAYVYIRLVLNYRENNRACECTLKQIRNRPLWSVRVLPHEFINSCGI